MLLVVVAAMAVTMQAQTVLMEQARRQAAKFLNEYRGGLHTATPEQMKLEAQTCGCCIFNAVGGGWAITSNGNSEPRVLAYADSGSLDGNSLPENMLAWLMAYENMVDATNADEREDVEPMLRTQWGQDAPYNSLCPMVPGEDGQTMVHAVAGCSNVAVAQLMNYHQWPHASGEVAYRWPGYPDMQPQSYATLPATTFDWEAMASSNEEGEREIAKLMQYVGFANSAVYRWDATSVYVGKMTSALASFGYDTSEEHFGVFDNIPFDDEGVYRELSAGRPVIFVVGLLDVNDAHSCVADGYSKGGFYHLNWGWNGQGNGYFLFPTSTVNTGKLVSRFYVQSMITARIKNDHAAINDVQHGESAGSAVFDLQGRRLAAKPRSGLYVKDGKKYLAR